MRKSRVAAALIAGGSCLVLGGTGPVAAGADDGHKIGINVLLETDPSEALLAELGQFGTVLDVIPEIDAVTLRAEASALTAIQALPYVAAANPDRERSLADATGTVSVPDFSAASNVWNLDAIDVTDAGAGRTVAEDGTGVFVAVMDGGLVGNWRAYFPEERIAAQFARCFGGGGGERGTVSSQPNVWEHDTEGHGTRVTSIVLGFRYAGPGDLPAAFNGVAPKATVIPVKVFGNRTGAEQLWSSVINRGLVYLTCLKTSGALGNAPLVINMSFGGTSPDVVELAAIDYAIAHGVVVVAAAHNFGAEGMGWPGAYAPVISAANAGWNDSAPLDDLSSIEWIENDVPENDPTRFHIFPTSSRELPGQDLDVAAPGAVVPTPVWRDGRVDYAFFFGTSAAAPHVAGVAALMLQKNPTLTQGQIESIVESSSMPLAPGSATIVAGAANPGNEITFSDFSNLVRFLVTVSWGADATGHGLLQADAALAATPLP